LPWQPRGRLTLRSSGAPTAWCQAREAVLSIIGLAGLAPRCRRPLSSNVRPQKHPLRQLELKVPPLALVAGFAAAIALLAYVAPSAIEPFPGHRLVAAALLLLGVVIAAAGVLQFRRAKTTVNPMVPSRASSVVAAGVFGWSRNPMYLGMAVALLGLSAWFATVPGYALVPLFCAYITEFQIKPEERALLASFGAEYQAYMARVRRWV
jgi:protein-S-isoprenylcysteine O-methyltransferase Ste14